MLTDEEINYILDKLKAEEYSHSTIDTFKSIMKRINELLREGGYADDS